MGILHFGNLIRIHFSEVSVIGDEALLETMDFSTCSSTVLLRPIIKVTAVPGDTLNKALTPNTIQAGFKAIGISLFDPDVFSEADFVQAVEQNAIEAAQENGYGKEDQRRRFSWQ